MTARIDVGASNEFIVGQSVVDGRWRWHWLAGIVGAGVKIEGTRSYPTKAAAFRGAQASIRRLRAFIDKGADNGSD